MSIDDDMPSGGPEQLAPELEERVAAAALQGHAEQQPVRVLPTVDLHLGDTGTADVALEEEEGKVLVAEELVALAGQTHLLQRETSHLIQGRGPAVGGQRIGLGQRRDLKLESIK